MKQSNTYPKFAVVGDPNKGKSSIVSSLARDDSIQIGNTPGTTQVSRAFPLKVDGEISMSFLIHQGSKELDGYSLGSKNRNLYQQTRELIWSKCL